jgi:hypothetical protein
MDGAAAWPLPEASDVFCARMYPAAAAGPPRRRRPAAAVPAGGSSWSSRPEASDLFCPAGGSPGRRQQLVNHVLELTGGERENGEGGFEDFALG